MVWGVRRTHNGATYYLLYLECLSCKKELGPYVLDEDLEGTVETALCILCDGIVEYVSRGDGGSVEIDYELEFEDAQR